MGSWLKNMHVPASQTPPPSPESSLGKKVFPTLDEQKKKKKKKSIPKMLPSSESEDEKYSITSDDSEATLQKERRERQRRRNDALDDDVRKKGVQKRTKNVIHPSSGSETEDNPQKKVIIS